MHRVPGIECRVPLEPGTSEPGTRNAKPGTRNAEPGTRNAKPGTRNPEPLHPVLYIFIFTKFS
jgi:hypothetical protein